MNWFRRLKEGIQTATRFKKPIPEDLWVKCPKCGDTITRKKLELGFVDLKPYPQRLKEAQEKSSSTEAITVAQGKLQKIPVIIAAMDFRFIGGSMGAVMGERICRAVDRCIEERMPLIIVSKSGGARMMEAAFSLMQMAKTTVKLTQLADAGLPYISYMTDPTTGGVTASFAMLGDVNIAEPGALIAFAGPRVVRQTIKRDLPEGFQTAEFLYEKGFIDVLVDRKEAKTTIARILQVLHHRHLPTRKPKSTPSD